jgi:succinyl-CoA synthetase beta subunit
MRCDVIAEGIISAAQQLSLTVPVVVRLAGMCVCSATTVMRDGKTFYFELDFPQHAHDLLPSLSSAHCFIYCLCVTNMHLSLVPLACLFSGTRVEEAKKMIAASGMDILTSENLDDAAQRAVDCSKMVKMARSLGLYVTFKEMKSVKYDAMLPAEL